MKTSVIILILAFVGMGSDAFAYSFQDPARVIAFSGVKIRTAPQQDAPLVGVVDFGEQLVVIDTVQGTQMIEWVEGNWVKVKFEGREGYVFNGFLTNLPVPMEEYELTSRDADATYPLISWTENNFKVIASPDTLQGENYIKYTQYFENGITLTTREGMYAFEVSLHIPGIRLGDAYNVTRSTMLTRIERELFEENALFIRNNNGLIDRIKISIDAPVEIRKTHDGVDITVTSYQHVCGL